ncbi:MAG TPA: CsbD family protein [Nocardioidaceae bacterium]|nr:CsbD family protein [Nocardioidaceae bacterium]
MGLDDKMKNKSEEAKGRAKEAAGSARGDEQMRAEGKDEQSKSDFKQAGEKAKDAFKR